MLVETESTSHKMGVAVVSGYKRGYVKNTVAGMLGWL